MRNSTLFSLITLFSAAVTATCLMNGYALGATALSAAITSVISFAALGFYSYEQRCHNANI